VTIAQNVTWLIQELPPGVRLLAAAKSRTPDEVKEAVAAGIGIIGENYIQEAESARRAIGTGIEWHFIGHLQKNKVKKAVELFDMIETVDSVDLAREIDRRCSQVGKTMPVLIEINSGRESQKSGVFPEKAEALIKEIASLENIRVMGLMTMGPFTADPEDLRPYFMATRHLFERIKTLNIPGVTMEYLSMGMTDSYRVAVEEGANLVRIGSKIFGPRSYP
jgi:pyridoxal phosphate enzyme (YggS family)